LPKECGPHCLQKKNNGGGEGVNLSYNLEKNESGGEGKQKRN